MNIVSNKECRAVVVSMITAIQANARMLSEVDGATGDGDHGINMNKGFSLCAQRLKGEDWDFTEGLKVLGTVLLEEIGGAMGPLYGSCFLAMSQASEGREIIDAHIFGIMLRKGLDSIVELGDARVGDKTLLDTVLPAVEAYEETFNETNSFDQALRALEVAAEKGMQSTKDMVAKKGRASRLGERSRGVLDAGAVSSYLLLRSMAETIRSLDRVQEMQVEGLYSV